LGFDGRAPVRAIEAHARIVDRFIPKCLEATMEERLSGSAAIQAKTSSFVTRISTMLP
jgi:hypothetical protein